ncbi:MAG: phosphoglycerate dehydrogenase [Rhodospirillaceae bacterium]|nr:MAG: phosphoglycerate dehydrogenase [Rhodospirillaceae bacterium]
MPSSDWRVAVTSRSFSNNQVLRKRLLKRFPNTTFNDEGKSLSGDELIRFLSGHDMAITALEYITEDVVANLPDLKVISKYGVGFDMIDLDALHRHDIYFGWKGGVNRRSVSELVIANAISMLRHVPAAHREVLSGTWRQHIGRQLTEKCVGIIGFGHIGKDLAKMLAPFKCEILAHDIVEFPEACAELNVKQTSLEDVLRRADVVSLHLPLDDSTRGMISAQCLSYMKHDAILINTCRGNVVDERALKEALKEGRLGGAAFDVFATEPPDDKELISLPNFLVSPHIGGSAIEAILMMGQSAIDGLEDAHEAIADNFL